jgi:hypothetical protein
MPAWLTPRVRLGVMVSIIGLIVCALLLTPGRSDNDGDAPDALAPPTVSTAPVVATPLATYKPRAIALPQVVIETLRLRSSESANESLPGATTGSTESADAGPDAGPDAWSRLVAQDVYGELVLAEPGILLNWSGCVDCTAPHAPLIPLSPVYTRPFGGGGGGTGGALLPDVTPPIGVTELGNPTLEETGPGDGRGSTPPGDLPRDPPPGDDDDPDPEKPPFVPVPEPSTVSLMTVAAFGVMVRAQRGRIRKA